MENDRLRHDHSIIPVENIYDRDHKSPKDDAQGHVADSKKTVPLETVIVRFGELSLKGKNHAQFEQQMVNNIRARLKSFSNLTLHRGHNRLYIQLNGTLFEDVREALRKIFGLKSFSPAWRLQGSWDAVVEASIRYVDRLLQSSAFQTGASVITFKVSARRALKSYPYTSQEIPQMLGRELLKRFPELKVDVHQPRFELMVEVRREGIFIYHETFAGAGGFPLGTSGKVLLLLSGGIDSPVAGWYMLRKGMPLEAVYFHAPPYTSEQAKQKVIDLAHVLATWGERVKLYIVPFTEIQEAIRDTTKDAYLTTIMRRYMLRIATRIAQQEKILALATGESLGQVASQTIESMFVIAQATSLPILRPLIGFDKTEIIEHARTIGTYDISIRPYDDCCVLFTPGAPVTRPRLADIDGAEKRSGMDELGMIERALSGMEVILLEREKPAPRLHGEPVDENLLNQLYL